MKWRSGWWLLVVGGCSFSAGGNGSPVGRDGGHAPADAPLDTYLPDAGTCGLNVPPMCIGGFLRSCPPTSGAATDTNCTWGCVSTGTPHCGEPTPSGNAVTSNDFADNPALHTVVLNGPTTINTDTGEITATGFTRPPGTNPAIQNGVNYQPGRGGNTIGFFGFAALTINGPVTVVGRRALALGATMTITVNGSINVQGTCSGSSAGPGGHPGGDAKHAATGTGGGAAGGTTDLDSGGGGGGGYGGTGGSGGGSSTPPSDAGVDAAPITPVHAAGGTTYGTPAIAVFEGGGGGGGGGGSGAGSGGGGGGAIELAAYRQVEIAGTATITASGCGGGSGTSERYGGGGGGGAGGTIFIEAAVVKIAGAVISDGGKGGLGGGGTTGGNGGAATLVNGALGTTDPVNSGGGGGGGVGRLRFSTAGGVITLVGEAISPALGSTAATLGPASVH